MELKGTVNDISNSAYIQNVNISRGKNYFVYNEDGELEIDYLSVTGNLGGTLFFEDSSKAPIGYLDAPDTVLGVYIPPTAGDGYTAIVAGTADVDGTVGVLKGSLAGFSGGGTMLLIDSASVNEFDAVIVDPSVQNDLLYYGISTDYTVDGVEVTVHGVGAGRRMKALSEGSLGGHAFLNMGSDLVAGDGITGAVYAAADAGFSFFSSISYGNSRYDTGSHVDVSGLSVLLGGAYGMDMSIGRFTVGAFFELGDGKYDSYNDFSGLGTVRGAGDISYAGGGLLARLDFQRSESGTTYAEFSGRVGRVKTEFNSDDFIIDHDYDLSATYYGLHLGFGRIFNLTGSTTFDLYGKWLYTHQGGKSMEIGGFPVRFDDIDSHRLRAGFRVTTQVNDWFKPYFGAAYEHELDGKAEASISGFPIDVPELKGGTGIGEIGVSMTAVENLTFDLGVRGFAGAREGVTGVLNLTYNF
jgi:hypothetical protein